MSSQISPATDVTSGPFRRVRDIEEVHLSDGSWYTVELLTCGHPGNRVRRRIGHRRRCLLCLLERQDR